MVSDRAPACVLHVDRMKRQHAGMLTHLEDLDRTLPAWRATATKEAAEPIRSALHGVSAAMAATPKGQLWNMLGAILAAQPDGGAAWLKKNMPGPAALVWRWIGAPRYAR